MLYKYKSKFVFNCEQNKKNIIIVEKLTSCFYDIKYTFVW